MMMFAKLTVAGIAGFFILKHLAGLLLPLIGLAVGAVGLALKLLFALAIGWLVLSIFRRRERKAV